MRFRDRQNAVAFLLATLLLAPVAWAEPVAVRGGEHPGRGRVVFDWSGRTGYWTEEADGRLILHFEEHADFQLPAKLPRNVLDMRIEPDGVSFALRDGAQPRPFRLGNRVVLDILDPPASRRALMRENTSAPAREGASAAAREGRAPGPQNGEVPLRGDRAGVATSARGGDVSVPATGAPASVSPSPAGTSPAGGESSIADRPSPAAAQHRPGQPQPAAPAASSPVPAAPPALGPGRPTVPLRLVTLPGGGRAMAVALPPEAGLAVLRRGDALLVAIDSALSLDLAVLRGDPVLGAADVLALPEATVMRLQLAAPASLRISRAGDTWQLEPVPEAVSARTLLPEAEGGALVLRAARPTRVIALNDPETGLPLLLGAVGEAGQGVAQGRRTPQMELLPTVLGVAVLARGDAVSLRPGLERFMLGGTGGSVVPAAARSGASGSMTRLFEIPTLDPVAAQERLRAQQAALAQGSPLARAALRRQAAETMLALGLAQEAQSMLRLSFAEDPRASLDPAARALHAAAALMAGRVAEAVALRQPEMPPSDELVLWRSLQRAAAGEGAEAGAGIAATLPLLLDYPAPLRERLAPAALEALLQGREFAAADRLLAALPALSGAAEARGRILEAEGKTDEALAAFDAAAQAEDRPSRARAIRAAAELRLRTGRLDAAAAARAMEPAIFAWREPGAEFAARLRVAELRGEGGDPRGALALLAETRSLFPERAAELGAPMTAALVAALRREPPLEAVALADANAALMPADAGGSDAFVVLADRLVALDLPDRAATVLSRVVVGSGGEARALAGTRLAELRLEMNDPPAASAALHDSAAPGLPPSLEARRALVNARVLVAQNQLPEAIAALRAMGPIGLEPLAALLAQNRDWNGAAEVLTQRAEQADADEELRQRVLPRAAAYAALSGDAARSAALRSRWQGKLADGAPARAFDVLTADPVRGLAELPRLQTELDLFRGFPGQLEPLRRDAASSR